MCWQQFQVVKGNFSQLFLHVGYHKISEIPAGAFNISIQETKKSRNYLGTHTSTQAHMHTYTGNPEYIFRMTDTQVKMGFPSSSADPKWCLHH